MDTAPPEPGPSPPPRRRRLQRVLYVVSLSPGKKFGSIGHIGAFSFNYYKNMTSGEGGGVSTSDDRLAKRARCAIDPCHFYWTGREPSGAGTLH